MRRRNMPKLKVRRTVLDRGLIFVEGMVVAT
jgi:hypothetical protein